jgi:valyl-tRNA synthetase
MLNDDGTLNAFCGKFAGMKRFDARLAVLEEIKKLGLYRDTTKNPMRVAICSRSKDIIEPRLVPQWYVDCKKAAADSVAAVREGRIEIVPKSFEADWYRWLENIRDWCVSRQLWWGHRIPAYLVTVRGRPLPDPHKNDFWVTGRTEAEALEKATKKFGVPAADILKLEQDPDVLDTWFSSGLFPFSVFGWPEETADLAKYFPGTLLETGYDILFFWVARMVMMSLMLTGKVPFKHVMLHAMVRDAHGRKMSKTLGNVVDPVDVIEGITLEALHEKLLHGNLSRNEIEKAKAGQRQDFPAGIAECGTDAMRFALCAYTSQGRDINLDINRVVGYRNFCNKLWNAMRFSLSKLGAGFVPQPESASLLPANASAMDRWILSRLSAAVREVNKGLAAYDLSAATSAVYNFWLYDLCDVYLEASKPLFVSAATATEPTKAACRETLYTCVESGLRLLHPFMPFVTEELWQRIPRRESQRPAPVSIMLAPFPILPAGYAALEAPEIEADFAMVMEVVRAVRSINAPYIQDMKKSGKRPRALVRARTPKLAALLAPTSPYAEPARALCLNIDGPLLVLAPEAPAPAGCAIEIVGNDEILCELRGIIDVDAELAKLDKRCQKLTSELATITAKVADPLFETKTPQDVRDATRSKISTLEEELRIAKGTIVSLASMK